MGKVQSKCYCGNVATHKIAVDSKVSPIEDDNFFSQLDSMVQLTEYRGWKYDLTTFRATLCKKCVQRVRNNLGEAEMLYTHEFNKNGVHYVELP